jgi:hypothetical protein
MILLVGPFVAVLGLLAVFFVLRRKSVDKRSMYSARRSQIEHKVRAARQRTLTPHGHVEKPAEAAPAAAAAPFAAEPTFAPKQTAPTIKYQPSAYQPPPVAPPPPVQPGEEQGPSMWDVGAFAATPEAPPAHSPETPAPTFPAQPPPAPYQPQLEPTPRPYVPPPEPTPRPAPIEPDWTPAAAPSEPAKPVEPARAAASSPAGSWSIIEEEKTGGAAEADGKKTEKSAAPQTSSSWQLASGNAPGAELEQEEVKRPSGTIVALAQYAILVVGLVMVLIGVLVMVANSKVT